MKMCFKCKEEKALESFYKHSGMKDGHLNKCKDCAKRDVRKNYKNNTEYYREYDKRRNKLEYRVMGRDIYAKSERGKITSSSAKKKWIEKNPVKRKAHILVGNAIRDGKLVKEGCQECDNLSAVAHHDDYSKPLMVRWLCPPCHKYWHDVNGEGINSN